LNTFKLFPDIRSLPPNYQYVLDAVLPLVHEAYGIFLTTTYFLGKLIYSEQGFAIAPVIQFYNNQYSMLQPLFTTLLNIPSITAIVAVPQLPATQPTFSLTTKVTERPLASATPPAKHIDSARENESTATNIFDPFIEFNPNSLAPPTVAVPPVLTRAISNPSLRSSPPMERVFSPTPILHNQNPSNQQTFFPPHTVSFFPQPDSQSAPKLAPPKPVRNNNNQGHRRTQSVDPSMNNITHKPIIDADVQLSNSARIQQSPLSASYNDYDEDEEEKRFFKSKDKESKEKKDKKNKKEKGWLKST